MKRYAELAGNCKKQRIKSRCGNKLDYRGEVIIAIHNDSEELRTIKFGERIAQLIVMPFYGVIFDEVDELSDTERGAGGFGSTGKK